MTTLKTDASNVWNSIAVNSYSPTEISLFNYSALKTLTIYKIRIEPPIETVHSFWNTTQDLHISTNSFLDRYNEDFEDIPF